MVCTRGVHGISRHSYLQILKITIFSFTVTILFFIRSLAISVLRDIHPLLYNFISDYQQFIKNTNRLVVNTNILVVTWF